MMKNSIIWFQIDTVTSVLRGVFANIGTQNGYRGINGDRCVRYDLATKKLMFDNNQDICYNGVGGKAVCKKNLGIFCNFF